MREVTSSGRFASIITPRAQSPAFAASFLGFVVAICLIGLGWPLASRAQVLEIGEGGDVTIYDRPAVFTADGAAPISAPRTIRPSRPRQASVAQREIIADAAFGANLSPALIEAVAWRESHLRAGVVSPAGAVGEMQLMPATARALGVDSKNSRQNYAGGASYLGALMRYYDGDLVRALAAYNAGPAAVDHYGGVPPFKETEAYVAAILNRLSQQVSGVDTGGSGR